MIHRITRWGICYEMADGGRRECIYQVPRCHKCDYHSDLSIEDSGDYLDGSRAVAAAVVVGHMDECSVGACHVAQSRTHAPHREYYVAVVSGVVLLSVSTV